MNQQEFEIVNDGQAVDKDFVNSWDILDYCLQYNGSLTISFVGAVIKNNKTLFSFPKHYQVDKMTDDQVSCMKQILYVLAKSKASYGSFDKGVKGEFPIKAYLGVLMHYKKYGLYLADERYLEKGYAGNVDWDRTVNLSNKIIQKKGVIFFPFVIKKNRDKSVFISECMNYVLSDASKYRSLISTIMQYEFVNKDSIFRNLKYVINELKKIKNMYFKDIEKRLINNLIEYIEWKSKAKNNVRLLTLKFENYWELMITKYLNDKFSGIIKDNSSEDNDKIIWSDNKKYRFEKPKMEYIETPKTISKFPNRKPHKIQYDHIFIDDENRYIVIFDSKYFKDEIDELNYKQLFYYYNIYQKYPEYCIDNGLLVPTEKDYYIKIHVDRTDLDGVKIVEHYINLKLVLDHYAKSV